MDGNMAIRMECSIAMVVTGGAKHGGHEKPAGQQHGSSKSGFVFHAAILPDLPSPLTIGDKAVD
jgi:hypothetical protein